MRAVQRTLVDAATLAAHLEDPRWVVVDCRWRLDDPRAGARLHAEGHIPGAWHADLDADLSSPRREGSGRHPLPEPAAFAVTAGGWGIGEDSQVVAYDDAGGQWAARLWWLLRWLGHDAVAVLDGGIHAWTEAGLALEREPPRRGARRFVATPDDSLWLDADEVAAGLHGGRLRLIDARAPARYRGEAEPIDPVAGHIPGALNLPFTGNLGPDGRFLAADALRARFAQVLGAAAATDAAVYCGSGVTACHHLLALEHAGLRGVRLYAGSWSEWIADPDRPIAKGDHP